MAMKTLYLPLKKEWYEMIERGEKTEEYRKGTKYWGSRLMKCYGDIDWCNTPDTILGLCGCDDCGGYCCKLSDPDNFKHFDSVRFSYGYTRRTMTFEVESITIGRGRPEWGAPDCDVFIIKLGRRL